MERSIKLEQLTKEYNSRVVVSDLSFTIAHGTIHGLLGPNGAGKTTTMKMIAGLIRPTSGHVSLYGVDPQTHPNETKRMLGMLPESPPLYGEMKVKEYLLWVAKIHGLTTDEAQDALKDILPLTGLREVENRLIGNLSKGFKQRVGIAQALIYSPKIVILDEPTSGLDPHSVVEIRELIKSLKADRTVIFSSHLLHEVELLCDEVTVIHQGKLKAHGSMSEVRSLIHKEPLIQIECDPSSLKKVLSLKLPSGVSSIHALNDHEFRLILNEKAPHPTELISWLLKEDIKLCAFSPVSPILEEVFIELTKEGQA
jgi:ABC-2 type transport system ATP-binding protein